MGNNHGINDANKLTLFDVITLPDNLFSKGMHTLKSIPLKCHLGFYRVLKGALDKVICTPDDIFCWEESIANSIRSWSVPGGSVQLVRETLAESSPQWSHIDEACLDLSAHHHLIASPTTVLDRIRSFSRGGGEAILHAVNRLIVGHRDNAGLSILLVDFINAFNLVDRKVIISLHAWYLDDGTIIEDSLVVGKILELIMEDGPRCGFHLNVNKTKIFWPKEDPRSRLAGVFPPNISWPLHGAKLLGGPASEDFNFSNELLMKRVVKTIMFMNTIAKINDPQCELLLLHACAGISKLYFVMRTCSSHVFEMALRSFDAAICSTLERIVTAYGPGFGIRNGDFPSYPLILGAWCLLCR
nr:hypothetical protein [Tanacetum cinerariifolium]